MPIDRIELGLKCRRVRSEILNLTLDQAAERTGIDKARLEAIDRKGRALSPHLQGLQQLSSGPGTNNCLMDQRGEAAQFVGTTESALAYWTTRSIKATCSMLSRPPLSPAIANPASVASVTSSWSVEVRAGISILPAPDGPFIHPRSAEPTRLCLSHHRPGSEAVTQPALTCRGLEARASKGFLRHRSSLVSSPCQAGVLARAARQPAGTGSAQIRWSIAPNRRRVR